MLIKVKIFPGEKTQAIIKKTEDSFCIKVKEKPIMNRANDEMIEVLANYFHIPKGKIRIVKGAKQRNKIIEILDRK